MSEEIINFNKQIETIKRYKRFPEIFGVIWTVKVDESPTIISPENFKDLYEDIYYDKLDNGNWGYFIGTFKFYEAASAYRRDMLEQGYKDAIIVAYHNGKRILIDEALALVAKSFAAESNPPPKNEKFVEDSLPEKVGETDSVAPAQPVKLSAQKTATSTVIEKKQVPKKISVSTPSSIPKKNISTKNNSVKATESVAPISSDNIEYRIQVAAAKLPIPSTHTIYKTFQNIYQEKNDDGYYRYYVGSYITLESAINGRKKVMDSGAKEALVVAFHNKKRISLAEAQKIISNSK